MIGFLPTPNAGGFAGQMLAITPDSTLLYTSSGNIIDTATFTIVSQFAAGAAVITH